MKLQSRSVFGATFGMSTIISECGEREPGATFRSYVDAPVMSTSLLERADIGCVMINSTRDACTVVAELRTAARIECPPGAGAFFGEGYPYRAMWMTPRSWLIHCRADDEWALAKRINDAFPDKSVHAVVFSDHLCWLELSGPSTFDLLSEGGFVSLERAGLAVGHAKRTGLAGVAVVLLHHGLQTWLIGVERSYAIYIADWLRASIRRSAKIAPRASAR